jgi:ribosomal protein S17E
MRKYKLFIFIFLFLFFLCVPNLKVFAEEKSDPKAAMIPSITDLYNYKENKYFSIYKDNYYLDLKETGMFNAAGGKIFNMLANFIFILQVTLAQIVIIIIYYAFEISFFDIFSKSIDSIMHSLQQGIFDELVLMFISLIGLFYIIKMIKNQRTQVWSAILQSIIVLVVALSFFRAPTAMLKGVDDLSKGIGHAALEGTFKATNNGKGSSSSIEAVSTNLWVMFIHKPWQIYEFGNTEFAEKNEEKILSLAPESEERQKIINEIAKDKIHFQPGVGLSRFAIAFIYFWIFIVQAFVVLILCFLMLGYQFLMILFAFFAPLVFLLALLPQFGFMTLNNWGSKVVGFGSMKAVMSLIISIVFAFMLATYDLSNKYGLLIIALIQVVCLAIIWIKRDQVLEGFLSFVSGVRQPNPAAVNKALRKDINVENGFKDWSRRRRGGNEDFNEFDLSYNDSDMDVNQVYDSNYGSYKNKFKNINGTKSSKSKYSDDSTSDRVVEVYTNSQNYSSDGINSINNNLNSLLKIAEEILEERYEKSKKDAEIKGEKLNKKPEYSNWVKQVKNRENMNLPKFEEREKLAVVNQIQEVLSRGGSVEELSLRENGELENKVTRPESLKLLSEEKQIKLEIKEQAEVKTDKEVSSELVQKFNTQYGKNYNDKFMENLISNYGQAEVKTVLKDMERIDSKDKIQNPAGYLTQSLKNNSMNSIETNMEFKSIDSYEDLAPTPIENPENQKSSKEKDTTKNVEKSKEQLPKSNANRNEGLKLDFKGEGSGYESGDSKFTTKEETASKEE